MNTDWVIKNLCFLTISGSQAYGTNSETSDVDVKGICVPPKLVREHLFERFDQALNNKDVETMFGYLKNPKNPKFESTVYSLQKFIQLAAQVNPNIIEVLWSGYEPNNLTSKVQYINDVGRKLQENRDLFLSTKAKFTFAGYAYAQAAKIERHRKWLVKGELKRPVRADYGLRDEVTKGFGEIERIIKQDIEAWNLSKYALDELSRQELKEQIWECVYHLTQNKITWDNWPEKYEQAALSKFIVEFNISDEIADLIVRETKYKNDLREYSNWLNWKEKRNLDRKLLEEKYMMDTKHAMHLIRLMKMGVEILTGKGVIVTRPDAEELLAIRNGSLTYEQLMIYFNRLNEQLDTAYKTCTLPKSVNYEKINNLYYELLNMADNG